MAKNYEGDTTPEINIIRKGTEIKGDVTCSGDIRVDGILIGTLKSEGKVVVGTTGSIEGNISCRNADISGYVNAKIVVNELLMLKSTASIVGDIKTNKLSIEPGADFTGACKMGTEIKGIKQNDKQVFGEEAKQTA